MPPVACGRCRRPWLPPPLPICRGSYQDRAWQLLRVNLGWIDSPRCGPVQRTKMKKATGACAALGVPRSCLQLLASPPGPDEPTNARRPRTQRNLGKPGMQRILHLRLRPPRRFRYHRTRVRRRRLFPADWPVLARRTVTAPSSGQGRGRRWDLRPKQSRLPVLAHSRLSARPLRHLLRLIPRRAWQGAIRPQRPFGPVSPLMGCLVLWAMLPLIAVALRSCQVRLKQHLRRKTPLNLLPQRRRTATCAQRSSSNPCGPIGKKLWKCPRFRETP